MRAVNMRELQRRLRKIGGCSREQAAKQALDIVEHWRAWVNDGWQYAGFQLTVTRNGVAVGEDALWGLEWDYSERSDMGRYLMDTIKESAHGIRETAEKARRAAIVAKAKETRERNYWAMRDVVTA